MTHDGQSPLERALAAALRDEADSISPSQRRLEIVQRIDAARTGAHSAGPHRPRRWFGAVLTGGALAAVMVGMVVVGVHRDPGPEPMPAATVTATARPQAVVQPHYPAPRSGPIPAYFTGADVRADGPDSSPWGLYREYLPAVQSTDSAQDRVRRAVDYSLAAAPASTPTWGNPSYLSSFPGVRVTAVTLGAEVTTVTLSGAGLPDADAERAAACVAALVRTAQDARGGEPLPVRIRVVGGTDELLNSVPLAQPFPAPTDPLTDIATSWIEVPDGLDPVRAGQAIAQGQSCAADGAVNWTIRASTTTPLRTGTLDVGDCSSRTPWRLDIGHLAPGRYTLELTPSDVDAEPGQGYARSFTVG